MDGFLNVAEKVLGPEDARKAQADYAVFRKKDGLFARQMLWDVAKDLPAYAWWDLYGGSTPTLQRLAMAVLAQPSSACACERNWSTYEFIHSKKRNSLSAKRAEDLVYTFTNRRMLDKIETVGYSEAAPQWWDHEEEEEEEEEEMA